MKRCESPLFDNSQIRDDKYYSPRNLVSFLSRIIELKNYY